MRIFVLLLGLLLVVGSAPAVVAHDHDHGKNFDAKLSGYNEVHFAAGPPAALRGAISTAASGRFRALVDKDAGMIDYRL